MPPRPMPHPQTAQPAVPLARSDKLRPGKLLKFVIGPGGITFQDGQPVSAAIVSLQRGPCRLLTLPRAAHTVLPSLRASNGVHCRPVRARSRPPAVAPACWQKRLRTNPGHVA